MTDAIHATTMPEGANRRRRALALLGPAILAGMLLLSACSGAPVGDPGSSSPAGSASGEPVGTVYDQALAYAECMRENGIVDFPDPDSNGGFAIKVEPGSGLDLSSPQFRAAEEKCGSLKPAGPGQEEGAREANLKYSQCMRDNGIESFPDPDSDGQILITGGPGSELSQDNPEFQAAQEACKEFRIQ